MTIRTTDSVFLGVVVQPKTKQPVYVVREPSTTKNIQIWAHQGTDSPGYFPIGRGYLEDDSGGEYARACELTGLPRAHTPGGVTVKGGGYGTCLYTGLVLLAVAAHDRKLFVSSLCGDGYGICSESETRSGEADAWWSAMADRGLVEEQKGTPESKEEVEDEDAADYMSRPAYRNVVDSIIEGIENRGDWSVKRVQSIRVDLERGSSGEQITADIFTMDSAESANLVAVVDVAQGDVMRWAKLPVGSVTRRYKDVILALNVAHEDSALVGKLGLAARAAGASDREVTAMLMRNRFGRDLYVGQAAPPMFPLLRDIDREIASGKRLPPPSEHGVAIPNPSPIRIPRRNPGTPTPAERRDLDRDLAELERRRADLGWDQIEDLP